MVISKKKVISLENMHRLRTEKENDGGNCIGSEETTIPDRSCGHLRWTTAEAAPNEEETAAEAFSSASKLLYHLGVGVGTAEETSAELRKRLAQSKP